MEVLIYEPHLGGAFLWKLFKKGYLLLPLYVRCLQEGIPAALRPDENLLGILKGNYYE